MNPPLTILALAALSIGQFQGGPPPGQGGPGGPPRGGEVKILAKYDLDKNKMLDAKERAAARVELASRPNRGGRMGGGPGGPGGRMAAGTPGPKVSETSVRAYPGKDLYDPMVIRTLFLIFENDNWEEELEVFNGTDVEVPAKVTVDGQTLANVGVSFRGASSYMAVPRGNKRSLNLSVDMVDGKQRLLGYKTLNLLNSNGDPSFMSTILYSHIARQYIAAPRANFVKVVVNGESWGIYVNVEQFNKDFVERNFKSTLVEGENGARWKVSGSPNGDGGLRYLGDDVNAYRQRFEIKTKDTEESWTALIDLCRTLDTTPPDQLEAKLRPILDIEGVLKFLALDIVLMNSDGYWTRASDYSLYRDPSGKFHIIPHDMNEAFRPGGMGGPGGPGGGRPGGPPPSGDPQQRPPQGQRGPIGNPFELDPLSGLQDPRKPLRSKLLAIPALRQKYMAYVRDIALNHLDWAKTGVLVNELRILVAPEIQADTRKNSTFDSFLAATNPQPPTAGPGGRGTMLRPFFDARRAYLLRITQGNGQ